MFTPSFIKNGIILPSGDVYPYLIDEALVFYRSCMVENLPLLVVLVFLVLSAFLVLRLL